MKNNKSELSFKFFLFDNQTVETEYSEYASFTDCTVNSELNNPERFGRFSSLYTIWKTENCDYIGLSIDGTLPLLSLDEIRNAINGSVPVIGAVKKNYNMSIREVYKDRYYDYDLNVLRKYLNINLPTISPALEELLAHKEEIIPSLILRKDVFRKFCAWAFPILIACNEKIHSKHSKMQDASLEHLGCILMNIYILNLGKKHKILWSQEVKKQKDLESEERESTLAQSLMEIAQKYVSERKVEKAIEYVERHKDDVNYPDIHGVFEKYNQQKRYYECTDLDTLPQLNDLICKYANENGCNKTGTKILVVEWNSVNNDEILDTFRELDYQVETVYITEIRKYRSESMDRLLIFLDKKKYDFVFTVNYFDYVSEACYAHDIPYIAWAYDSPVNLGNLKYARYQTTHIFMFDSDEVKQYKAMGFSNVNYLPLAVNVDKLDQIKCSSSDVEEYQAEISFVGSLYNTRLTEYLNYLPDYKKGFFNALLDFNTGRYDSYTIEDVFSMDLAEWLDEKAFKEAVYKGELEDPRSPILSDDMVTAIAPRVGLLTNKTITNRERLLLVSILSNHWDFKLYSDSGAEVFKNVKEMGRVDYYTEMPKVFKCSKINLNTTFKNIKTGMPQRCLDIMGCGGLLLTNYQRDFDEHFVDGENIVLFKSFDEAFEKCEYYLSNEDTRKKVALNGYRTVREYYTYRSQIKKAIEISGLGWTLKE